MAISVVTITLEEKGRRGTGKDYHQGESKYVSRNPVANLSHFGQICHMAIPNWEMTREKGNGNRVWAG